jgi:hypothetical protein
MGAQMSLSDEFELAVQRMESMLKESNEDRDFVIDRILEITGMNEDEYQFFIKFSMAGLTQPLAALNMGLYFGALHRKIKENQNGN